DRRPKGSHNVAEPARVPVREAAFGRALGRPRELALVGIHDAAVVDEETVPIEHRDPRDAFGLVEPFLGELSADLPRDAETRRAGTENHDALLRHRLALDRERAVQPGDDDGTGALDVVVERRHAVDEAIEDPERVVLAKVLPLDQR